jgi:hypothetical protein
MTSRLICVIFAGLVSVQCSTHPSLHPRLSRQLSPRELVRASTHIVVGTVKDVEIIRSDIQIENSNKRLQLRRMSSMVRSGPTSMATFGPTQ